jgi:hypothetical protein
MANPLPVTLVLRGTFRLRGRQVRTKATTDLEPECRLIEGISITDQMKFSEELHDAIPQLSTGLYRGMASNPLQPQQHFADLADPSRSVDNRTHGIPIRSDNIFPSYAIASKPNHLRHDLSLALRYPILCLSLIQLRSNA